MPDGGRDPYDPRNWRGSVYDKANHRLTFREERAIARDLMRTYGLRTLADYAGKALQSGTGEVRIGRVHWDVSNGCTLPREVELVIQPVGRVTLTVACRTHCERCLRRRKVFWAHRAKHETMCAQRTWFGTLTLRPKHLAAARRAAVRRAMSSGVNWNDLTPGEEFARIAKECTKALQLWMKRVRKVSGARLRYILVCEAHESGAPHWHCLVHEVYGSASVTERELRLSWTKHGGGFTDFSLVRRDVERVYGKLVFSGPEVGCHCTEGADRAAFYVCKYLSKDALTRVMASGGYGRWGPQVDAWDPALPKGSLSETIATREI